MHGQGSHAAAFCGQGIFHSQIGIVPAGPHFDRQGNIQDRSHFLDDVVDLVWVLEPLGTGLVFDDLVDGATHVDVHDVCLGIGLDKVRSPLEALGIPAEELDGHRKLVFLNVEHVQGFFIVIEQALFGNHFHDHQTSAHFLGNGPKG